MAERWQQWMPFHIDRWRGSPSVQAMHPAAQMGYLNMLCSCWQSVDCCLPDDPIDLATESRLGDELWALYGPRILRKFVLIDGRWRNEVLFAEWDEARKVYEKRKSGAVRTNASRSADGERAQPSRNTDTQTITGTNTETTTKEEKRTCDGGLEPEMVARVVLVELALAGPVLEMNLSQICKAEMAKGTPWEALKDELVSSWREYELARSNLTYSSGAAKFFGEGVWKNRNGWPWKEGKKPAPSRKYME